MLDFKHVIMLNGRILRTNKPAATNTMTARPLLY